MWLCQELGERDAVRHRRFALILFLVLVLLGTSTSQEVNGTSSSREGHPEAVLCRVGTHNVTSVANMPSINKVFILDFPSTCSGLVKRVCAVFAIPLDRSVLNNSEIFLATYRIVHINGTPPSLEMTQGPVSVNPSEIVYDAINAVVILNLNDDKALPMVEGDRIGILIRAPQELMINSTNMYSAYQTRVSASDNSLPPQTVALGTRSTIAPFVWFEIGEDSGEVPTPTIGVNNTTSNPASRTTTAPTNAVEDESLLIGMVATIVAAIFVVLACSALFITIAVKFYRRRKREASKVDPDSGAGDDSIRRPSAASIQSRNLGLQPPRRAEQITASLPNLIEEGTAWPLNNTMDGVFISNTLPHPCLSSPTKPPPFPIPNYEMQSTLSTIVLSDRLGTAQTKTATMNSTMTEGPYDIPADDQYGPGKGTLLYSKTDYDDIVDTPYEAPPSKEDKICDYLRRKDLFRVERDEIKVVEYIGNGNFADIHKALWSKPSKEQCYVATKTLVSKSPKDKVRFLQEAHIMSQFNHNNIVKIYGVLAEKKPVMIVLELLQGDLRQFLKDKGSLLAETCPDDLQIMFLRFAREIADGMKYLSKKGFIHRDLAARNVLTTEDLTCKISDFGLARDLSGDAIYQSQGGSIPVKWTAPEVGLQACKKMCDLLPYFSNMLCAQLLAGFALWILY
jgi:hypothetical protein